MFQSGSLLAVIDNSFIKEIKVIRVLKNGKHPKGFPGDIVIASVKSLRAQKVANLRTQRHLQSHKKKRTWSKGDIVHALIARSSKNLSSTFKLKLRSKKNTGFYQRFSLSNAAIILEGASTNPVGSRIKGPISIAIKSSGYSKVTALSKNII